MLAAALSLHLELEVEETGEFGVEAPGIDVPLDRSNLCVRAFESLRPADGLQFRIASEIPLAAGLGSSAAAIVAGLLAADHLRLARLDPDVCQDRHQALAERVELLLRVPDLADAEGAFRAEADVDLQPVGGPLALFQAADAFVILPGGQGRRGRSG